MFIILPLLFLSVFYNICSTSTTTSSKVGACFRKKSPIGCTKFIDFMSRKQCCQKNGYFVREPNQGQLFLVTFLNQHSIPNCENSCSSDYCQNKVCPAGQFCIMRENDSICSSDCVCTQEQRLSGPICLSNGRRYKNLCEVHLESCWHSVNYTISPCASTGCSRLGCETRKRKCVLTLKGHIKCMKPIQNCRSALYKPLCGVDNVTYSNMCHWKQASIMRQQEIQIAYKGICKADASCLNVECPHAKMDCIAHHRDSSPVCIICPKSMLECIGKPYKTSELLCLSAKFETRNTCYKDFLSCQNNYFYEILNSGQCLLSAKWPR